MKEAQAFYYQGEYYLFPEGCTSITQLRGCIYDGILLKLPKLCRKGCIPPFFMEDRIRDCRITIEDCRRIYPVTVYILSREAYEQHLREVVEVKCPGCGRYGGDAKDLTGHFEEISLAGHCLEREWPSAGEGLRSPYEPAYAVEDFWWGFIKIEPELAAAVSAGDILEATTQISALLAEVEMQEYIFPAVSKYEYRDPAGRCVTRYVLMLTGGGILCSELIANYFIRRIPEVIQKQWDVYPYGVRGFYRHFPLFTGCNPEADPPLLQVMYLEQQDLFTVRMFVRWDANGPEAMFLPPEFRKSDEEIPTNIYCANYMYLCQVIGEERLRGAVLELVPFPKSEMVFEGDCVTAEEFSRMIDDQIQDKSRLAPGKCSYRSMDMEGMQEQRPVSHLRTYCEQLSFDFILGFEGPSQYLWEGGFSLGSLFVPEETLHHEDDVAYLTALLKKALVESFYAEAIDICEGPEGVYFDFVVFHKVNARKALRGIAPELAAFGAVYTERLGSDICTYPVELDMRGPE